MRLRAYYIIFTTIIVGPINSWQGIYSNKNVHQEKKFWFAAVPIKIDRGPRAAVCTCTMKLPQHFICMTMLDRSLLTAGRRWYIFQWKRRRLQNAYRHPATTKLRRRPSSAYKLSSEPVETTSVHRVSYKPPRVILTQKQKLISALGALLSTNHQGPGYLLEVTPLTRPHITQTIRI
ncbi:uncharacterized protein LOC132935043 isoform X2 [Metopolophium dirhodum]|uniref:uncharacterized protein LOC132935043 isoform X2 n=1 Tax=Metopolophium dirhodum TaxID=44670 RepID=UPI00298F5A81|nr:uncharacterized protein LOC132935043 isoform X2 [Metopolophium dirhodum]